MAEQPASSKAHAGAPHVQNVNKMHEGSLNKLERLALVITDKVGSMGFFLIIFTWTVLWCGYNILASQVPALGWHAFDPFPAFVAYLLISNVIQILLMPLIMVGQNLQGRHSEMRAENDYEINVKAEMEVKNILHHLEEQNEMLICLAQQVGVAQEEIMRSMPSQWRETKVKQAADRTAKE